MAMVLSAAMMCRYGLELPQVHALRIRMSFRAFICILSGLRVRVPRRVALNARQSCLSAEHRT